MPLAFSRGSGQRWPDIEISEVERAEPPPPPLRAFRNPPSASQATIAAITTAVIVMDGPNLAPSATRSIS